MEHPPKAEVNGSVIKLARPGSQIQEQIKTAQDEYKYWDKAKYTPLPKDVNQEQFWNVLKYLRTTAAQQLRFGKYIFSFNVTPRIQKALHEFDMNYGGQLKSGSNLHDADRSHYIIRSIIEEAITSSQIEGAVTTREVAKEMLEKGRKPRNISEKMIFNNFTTIEYIRTISSEPLSEKSLKELQRLITDKTLDEKRMIGHYREDDSVNVVDNVTGDVVHYPPPVQELPALLADLYRFFNEEDKDTFIHPVIKASIIHFMIGYIHPFVDGNGRTARALFYWYMLKKGYWLMEYLSISSVILHGKGQYAKAYQYSGYDDKDLTYFILYSVKTLQKAYAKLQAYLERKLAEKRAATKLLDWGDVNMRQAEILQWLMDEPERYYTAKELETTFGISNPTARADLQHLQALGYLTAKKLNKKQVIFLRSEGFDGMVGER